MPTCQQLWDSACKLFYDRNVPPDKPITVCYYDQSFIEFADTERRPLRYFVSNRQVYITHPTSPLHVSAENFIRMTFEEALNDQVPGTSFKNVNGTFSLICNKYACHSIQQKYPDGAIVEQEKFAQELLHPLIVFEVAYTHEPCTMLILECAAYLTEFTRTTVYAVGIKIAPHTSEFHMTIFIFKRLIDPDEEAIERMEKLYRNHQYYYPIQNSNTDSGDKCNSLVDVLDTFSTSELFKPSVISKYLQVSLVDMAQINESDILSGRSIHFSLEGTYFRMRDNTPINVEISNEVLRGILSFWYEERENR